MLIRSIQACIQNALKDHSHQEKGYPNCSTPWNEDILKLENDTNRDLKSCDCKEKETQFYLDINSASIQSTIVVRVFFLS